ncbi:MAG: glycosyltransferase family 4 protein [Phycisphaerae bacterium]|nr:glycosyltransferase family 4 protein [Tepidisphaeraceae bacterium]
MKVALSFPGCHRRAGVERVMFECARFLARNGHDVHVFAREWEPDPVAPIAYHGVPSRHRPWFLTGASYYAHAVRMLDRRAFDVVNTHGVVCPTGGVHWVQSVHAAWLERARAHRPFWSLARWKQALNPVHRPLLSLERQHFAGRAYRKVIATTPDVRDDLGRFYGVPEKDVVIVPNGFSPEEFNPARRLERRDAARARVGLTPDHVAVLFVANELERKGYRTLLAALRILNRPELRVLVVGRPPKSKVTRLARAMGVAQQVIPCGPTGDVAVFHAAADLFVLPTQYEAFCLAILEALGSGLPVVTTNVPGARDAIRHGINGLLIEDPRGAEELAGALRRMLDPDVRRRMTDRAADSVAAHQWPVVLRAYEEVLRGATSTPAPTQALAAGACRVAP